MTTRASGRGSTLTWLAPLLVAVLVVALWWVADRDDGIAMTDAPSSTATAPTPTGATAHPSTDDTPESGLRSVPESRLPREARATLALIRAGGPYPYDQDDRTFQNRERILPRQASGYYREYTVETPGSDDRGARRIIGGRDGDRYWTSDHYDSFRQIEEGR